MASAGATIRGWEQRILRSVCLPTDLIDTTRAHDYRFKYIDVSSVSNQSFKITGSVEHTAASAPSRARKQVRTGDVIVATVRPTLKRVAIVPADLDGQVVSTAFCVCRIDPRLADNRFVYFTFLQGDIVAALGRLERGANYPAVSDGDVQDQAISLPGLPEQRSIAGALTRIQLAVDNQGRIVESLIKLKAATLVKLFGQGVDGGTSATTPYGDVPASWETKSLNECAVVQTGVAKGKKFSGPTVERPYLRVANVQDGYLDLSEIKTIALREDEVQRYLLRDGDVLLTEGGDFDKLGRGYVWRNQIEGCVHQNHIFAVRTNRDVLLPDFFAHQIQSPYGKAYFLNVAHKTTNLACINSTKLKEFPVLVPPIDDQSRITSAIHGIDATINAAVTKRGRLQLLFEESLKALMSGSLSVTPLLNG